MKRNALQNLLVGAAVILPAAAVAAIALSSPVSLVRAMLPQPDRAALHDLIVAAAETGALRRHIRPINNEAGPDSLFTLGDQPLKGGDRLTITSPDGNKTVYAIRSVRALAVPLSKTSDGTHHEVATQLVLVTAENVTEPSARPLRFIMESGQTTVSPALSDPHQAL
jgi:hypothetical protein